MTKLDYTLVSSILICAFQISGCGSSSIGPKTIEGAIASAIKKNCKREEVCRIRVSSVTNFDWDKFYAFDYDTGRAEIEKTIGKPLPQYQELTRKLIFLKDNKVVKVEDEPVDVERPLNDQVIFDPARRLQISYAKETVFEVNFAVNEDRRYFELLRKDGTNVE